MTWIFTIVLVKETRTIESIKKKKKKKKLVLRTTTQKNPDFSILTVTMLFFQSCTLVRKDTANWKPKLAPWRAMGNVPFKSKEKTFMCSVLWTVKT